MLAHGIMQQLGVDVGQMCFTRSSVLTPVCLMGVSPEKWRKEKKEKKSVSAICFSILFSSQTIVCCLRAGAPPSNTKTGLMP
jgi:hypothetical protein